MSKHKVGGELKEKTLHMPKNKRTAKIIDDENNKILTAILNVKPSKCSSYDPDYMHQQEKYMVNITRSQRQSMNDMITRRAAFLE